MAQDSDLAPFLAASEDWITQPTLSDWEGSTQPGAFPSRCFIGA